MHKTTDQTTAVATGTTIVKTSEAYDFLALVPQLLGFLPENSIILVAFRGNRTCGAMRFNLPGADAPEKVLKRIATTLIGTLCKIRDVDALVPVVYTDDGFASVPGIPRERFADILVRRAELAGFLVRDALCVGADAWGSYLAPDAPAGGSPLSDIAASSAHRAIPDDRRRDLASLRSGAELPKADPAARERLFAAYRRHQRLGRSGGVLPELVSMVGDILDPVAGAEAALTWDAGALDAEAAAELLFLIQGPGNRDQMMLQFAFGEAVGIESHEMNLRYWAIQEATGLSLDAIVRQEQDGAGGEEQTGNLILGLTTERPDSARIERAIELLKALVALAPRSARPAPLCMLSWLSWALGRGSVAGIFIEAALGIDRHYGMALLLNTLLGSGHLPDWAYAVPTEEAANG